MGWYTAGPGGLEYRYGDVVAAARAAGVGVLKVAPRLSVDGDSPGDLEFLDDLQAAVERVGLPWRHVEFTGSWVTVESTADPEQALTEYADLLDEHVDSVREAVGGSFTELAVSMDVQWTVPPEALVALTDWLDAPLVAPEHLSIERLRGGDLQAGWYVPPPQLTAVFDRFAERDPARHLVAHALAHLALAGEVEAAGGLWLTQPHEVLSTVAWQYAGVVLFRPVDHPFVDRLAQAFGLPAALRERVFHLCDTSDGGAVTLPPESDVPPADARAGLAFDACLCRVVAAVAGNRFGPLRDGGRSFRSGWHPDASLAELAALFTAAGRPVRSLDEVLSGARRTWQGHDTETRLVFWAEDDGQGVADFLLDGRGDCPALSTGAVAALLVLLERLDLTGQQLRRLDQLLRTLVSVP